VDRSEWERRLLAILPVLSAVQLRLLLSCRNCRQTMPLWEREAVSENAGDQICRLTASIRWTRTAGGNPGKLSEVKIPQHE
jgi:hypothetical protein